MLEKSKFIKKKKKLKYRTHFTVSVSLALTLPQVMRTKSVGTLACYSAPCWSELMQTRAKLAFDLQGLVSENDH